MTTKEEKDFLRKVKKFIDENIDDRSSVLFIISTKESSMVFTKGNHNHIVCGLSSAAEQQPEMRALIKSVYDLMDDDEEEFDINTN